MIITCFFVPVDSLYLDYFNWQTLASLSSAEIWPGLLDYTTFSFIFSKKL